MKIPITLVPQADELTKVISTVEAVYKKYVSDSDIGDYVGFTDRQGRYYRLAAEILGLLENENNNASLTSLGEELVVLDESNRIKRLRTILQENDVFKRVLGMIEKNENGVNRKDLLNFLSENIEGAPTTIERRLSTIINWLEYCSLISLSIRDVDDKAKETETVYVFNDRLDESDFIENANFQDSIYPANYSNEELDIKESHMQVVGLLRKKEQGKIIIPEFQRNQVWKQQQKSKFIESLILNIPIPPFYISQDLDGNSIIIDGLQRSTAIFEFFADEYRLVGLEALPLLNNSLYSELDEQLRVRIQDRELLLYILKHTVPMSIVYDIFNRINSNGSPLTSQEIRNCIYIGKSTRLLAELAELEFYKTAIDHGVPSLRMKDREAILRFFAFILFDYKSDYKNDMDDFLGKTMRKINRLSDIEINELRERFVRVMKKTFEFFQYNNFRLPTENSRGKINIALMEAICVFFDKKDDVFLDTYRSRIVDNYYNKLLNDVEFVSSIRTSTNSLRNVKTRFEKAYDILTGI